MIKAAVGISETLVRNQPSYRVSHPRRWVVVGVFLCARVYLYAREREREQGRT